MPLQDAWGLPAIVSHMGLSIVGQTVPSRVGESKILKHSERACPLGCISAQSRSGPPTTYKALLVKWYNS